MTWDDLDAFFALLALLNLGQQALRGAECFLSGSPGHLAD